MPSSAVIWFKGGHNNLASLSPFPGVSEDEPGGAVGLGQDLSQGGSLGMQLTPSSVPALKGGGLQTGPTALTSNSFVI